MNPQEQTKFQKEFNSLTEYPFIKELFEKHPAVYSVFNSILEGEYISEESDQCIEDESGQLNEYTSIFNDIVLDAFEEAKGRFTDSFIDISLIRLKDAVDSKEITKQEYRKMEASVYNLAKNIGSNADRIKLNIKEEEIEEVYVALTPKTLIDELQSIIDAPSEKIRDTTSISTRLSWEDIFYKFKKIWPYVQQMRDAAREPNGGKKAQEIAKKAIADVKKYYPIKESVEEAVEKIACLQCDAVSTAAAWKKNKGFCPVCKTSSQGVAESKIEESEVDAIADIVSGLKVGDKTNFGVIRKIGSNTITFKAKDTPETTLKFNARKIGSKDYVLSKLMKLKEKTDCSDEKMDEVANDKNIEEAAKPNDPQMDAYVKALQNAQRASF